MKLDGKKFASEVLESLKTKVINLKSRGITPTLAVILIGDDENSIMYIKQKKLKAEEIGAQTVVHNFKPNVKRANVEDLIKKLDADPKVHGIILQRPAPAHLMVDEIEKLISPQKAIDGFGSSSLYPVPVAEAVFRMIKWIYDYSSPSIDFFDWLSSKRIVVIGKGQTAGRPIIEHIEQKGLQVKVIDSKTPNPNEIIKEADIVVSAVGREDVLDPKIMKERSTLIGVGLHTDENGKLKGDFNDKEAEEANLYYSPTPGGVGPLNVACLMENLVKAASYE